jgi:isopropylmalate/homocitrate/citramalate synthase
VTSKISFYKKLKDNNTLLTLNKINSILKEITKKIASLKKNFVKNKDIESIYKESFYYDDLFRNIEEKLENFNTKK